MGTRGGTLLARLTRALSVGILAVIAVFLVVLYHVQRGVLVANAQGAMAQQCRILRIMLQGADDEQARTAVMNDFYERVAGPSGEVSLALYTYPGHPLTPHGKGLNPAPSIEFIQSRFQDVGDRVDHVEISGPPEVVGVTVPVYNREGRRTGLLYYAQPAHPFEELAVRLLLVEAAMMLVLWGLAVLITYVIVRVKVAAPLLHLYVRQHQASRGEYRPLEVEQALGTEIAQLYEGHNEVVAALLKQQAERGDGPASDRPAEPGTDAPSTGREDD
jgi:hypothetical protein